jgi:hypothetical protein
MGKGEWNILFAFTLGGERLHEWKQERIVLLDFIHRLVSQKLRN